MEAAERGQVARSAPRLAHVRRLGRSCRGADGLPPRRTPLLVTEARRLGEAGQRALGPHPGVASLRLPASPSAVPLPAGAPVSGVGVPQPIVPDGDGLRSAGVPLLVPPTLGTETRRRRCRDTTCRGQR